jgi:hypothetical protein
MVTLKGTKIMMQDPTQYDSVSGPVLDKAGIVSSGFVNKKGTASGEGAMFNMLPPGPDIDNQETFDGVGPSFVLKQLVNHNGYDGYVTE